MRWLIEALTVFDWITPIVETGKDVAHAISSDEGTNYFKISSRNELVFRKACKELGVTVVSKAHAPFQDMIVTVGDLKQSDLMYLQSLGIVKDFGGRCVNK